MHSLTISAIEARCRRAGLALAVVAVLGSQAAAATPAFAIPERWTAQPATSQAAQGDAWWRDFGDPSLDNLVASALDANQDLKSAAARLVQARALVDGAESERRPRLDGVAGAQRGRNSSAEPRMERSSVGLRAAWEVDVFGRGGLAIDAAAADRAGVAEALRAARIAVAADVATTYFSLRTLERRLALKHDGIELAQRQLDVAIRKFDAGQATSLDQARWRAELAQERAAATLIEGEFAVRRQQLALLLGAPGVPQIGAPAVVPAAPVAPASVLPGELLEHRPDVVRQARALDAALARAGVARRDLYPRLEIDWSGAKERLAAAGGSAAPRVVVGYGLTLSLPILDGGRIRSNIAVQDARAQEAMADYEKAMLTALVDVETGLARWSAAGDACQEWGRAAAAADVAARHAARVYTAGGTDVTAVLDARRAHLQARDGLAQAEGARWEAAVGLRRAFAGGIGSAPL